MSKLVSPNTMLDAAKDYMLEGREPDSYEDWALVMNFMAANVQEEVAHSACRLMAKIYAMPLSDEVVEEIVAFQLLQKHEHNGH